MSSHIADDSVFHILQFLDSKFIINVCMRISTQWLRKSKQVDLSIDFSQSLNGGRCIKALTQCPNVTKLTDLNLSKNYIGGDGAKAIADSPFMSNLRSLNLDKTGVLYKDGLKHLVSSSNLSNLTSLSLSKMGVNDDIVKVITSSSVLGKLMRLSLGEGYGSEISLDGLNMILCCSQLFNLTSLAIGMDPEEVNYYNFGNVQLVNLTELKLGRENVSAGVLCNLLGGKKFPKLKHLQVSVEEGSANVLKTITENCFTDLETLEILGTFEDEDTDCLELANCSHLSNLTKLSIPRKQLTRESFQQLSSSQFLTKLKHLEVSGTKFTPGKAFQNLTHVELSGTLDAHAIATSPFMRNLKTMSVRSVNWGVDGLKHLTSSPNLCSLTSLLLPSCQSRLDMKLFAKARFSLTSLDFTYSKLGSVKDLVACSTMKHLKSLLLSSNSLDGEEAVQIANSEYMSNLTELDLGSNAIGDVGLNALSSSPYMKNLNILLLKYCGITTEGVKALAKSPFLTQLTELILDYNNVCDEGIIALCASEVLSNITSLGLSITGIGIEGTKAIASCAHLSNLSFLDLDSNGFGDHKSKGLLSNEFGNEGCIILASSPYLGRLTDLIVSDNHVRIEGVTALIDNLERLSSLRVFENYINDQDARVLMQNPNLMKLSDIMLTYNLMSDECQEELASHPYLEFIESSSLGGRKYIPGNDEEEE